MAGSPEAPTRTMTLKAKVGREHESSDDLEMGGRPEGVLPVEQV